MLVKHRLSFRQGTEMMAAAARNVVGVAEVVHIICSGAVGTRAVVYGLSAIRKTPVSQRRE